MKCVVCASKGRHFPNKICPTDTEKGYVKGDVKFKRHTKKFVGEAATEAANNFVAQLRADKEQRFYNIRQSAKVDRYAKEKNEATIVYFERQLGPPGGSDGKGPNKKSK